LTTKVRSLYVLMLTLYRQATDADQRYEIDVANTLQNMGIVLDDLADYRNSLACYTEVRDDRYCSFDIQLLTHFLHEQALRIRQFNFGDLDPQVADTYQYIGKVLAITGEPERALENFTKAIRIHEEILRWSPEPVDDIPCFLKSLVRLSRVDVDLFKSRYGRVMECYEEGMLNLWNHFLAVRSC